jgi:hypothetical protein
MALQACQHFSRSALQQKQLTNQSADKLFVGKDELFEAG